MADQNLRVRLMAITADFSRGMKSASSKLTAFGTKAKQIGSQLKSIQLPLAIAGGAAVKLAVDFDKSMTQIQSLVGIAGDEVEKMGERAKKMASDTGQSATAAADSLFFITSAGLRGEEAMQVLEASLKSAAIGLGEAKTVADLATSAMNAYGSEVLSATGATDVLGAAVREGKLEASTLAGAMGSVLPVASNMGVQFHEVGAAFAAMSRTGTDAAQASTQLNSIMMGIMKPSEDAKKALTELGLSSEGLRRQIKEKGLLSVFMTLKDASDQNAAAFERVFGNVRALKGIMDLTGAGFESTRKIFDSMADTAGFTADAFDKTSQSASFQLTKSMNEVKVAFTETGAVILKELLPYFKQFAAFIKRVFERFSDLEDGTKKSIVQFGALVLIAPTVISLVGSLATAFGTLGKAIAFMTSAQGLAGMSKLMKAFTSPAAIIVAAVGTVIIAFDKLTKSIAPNVSLLERFKIVASNLAMPHLAMSGLAGAEIQAKADKGIIKGGRSSIPFEELDASMAKANASLENGIKPALVGVKQEMAFVGQAGIAAFEPMQIQVTAVNDGLTRTKDKGMQLVDAFANLGLNAGAMFKQISFGLQQSFQAMLNGENFFKTFGKMIGGMIKQLLAAAAAAFILSTILGGLGIGAIGGSKTNFKSLFGNLSGFGAFANGGIVSSPTLGLVGEYAGARSNPEVIAPLDRLKSLMGDRNGGNVNVSGQFRLDGQDLVVALERANKQRNNFV
jgi:TP901 family phage tail tape measure protein